jgi:hypothetical protein
MTTHDPAGVTVALPNRHRSGVLEFVILRALAAENRHAEIARTWRHKGSVQLGKPGLGLDDCGFGHHILQNCQDDVSRDPMRYECIFSNIASSEGAPCSDLMWTRTMPPSVALPLSPIRVFGATLTPVEGTTFFGADAEGQPVLAGLKRFFDSADEVASYLAQPEDDVRSKSTLIAAEERTSRSLDAASAASLSGNRAADRCRSGLD